MFNLEFSVLLWLGIITFKSLMKLVGSLWVFINLIDLKSRLSTTYILKGEGRKQVTLIKKKITVQNRGSSVGTEKIQ